MISLVHLNYFWLKVECLRRHLEKQEFMRAGSLWISGPEQKLSIIFRFKKQIITSRKVPSWKHLTLLVYNNWEWKWITWFVRARLETLFKKSYPIPFKKLDDLILQVNEDAKLKLSIYPWDLQNDQIQSIICSKDKEKFQSQNWWKMISFLVECQAKLLDKHITCNYFQNAIIQIINCTKNVHYCENAKLWEMKSAKNVFLAFQKKSIIYYPILMMKIIVYQKKKLWTKGLKSWK